MTRACALLLLMAGCSSAPRPPVEAPPRLEPTCDSAAQPQAASAFAIPPGGESEETARVRVQASNVPASLTLGDRTVRILDVVQRCEGDRLQFLGLLLEAERGPVAIGFSPPRAEAAPYARADNACHMDLEAYCAAACPGGSYCILCAEPARHTQGRGFLELCSNSMQLELSRKALPLTDDQRARGITESFLTDRLVVREYLADATTGTWDTILVVRELHTTEFDPKLVDEQQVD